MSGAHGAWQYRTQQGLSEDGTTFWSKARGAGGARWPGRPAV